MSISSKDIRAAVGLLDAKDATLWAAPGVPTLAAMEALVPGVTAEEIVKAGFVAPADEGDNGIKASKETVINKETGANPPTVATASQEAEAPLPEVPAELPAPDATPVDLAMAIIARSQAELRKIEGWLAEANNERAKITQDIADLVVVKDKHLHLVEAYSPRVAFSASVKAIQRQTVLQNAARQVKQKELRDLHLAQGTVFPSALDASLAARRKTPQQAANLAAFIAQNSQRQIAERG